MRILRAADHRTMPWKNGGGSTTEIAVAPAGAGIDDFDWRVSMAVVAADGPFSLFPGVDRTLAVLEGAGLVLHGLGTGPQRLDRTTAPLAFPADAPVSATLPDGPITDLNVMTRRGRFTSRVRRITAAGPITAAAVPILLLAEAPCEVTLDGATVALGRRDALRLDGPATLAIASGGAVHAYLIELQPA